MRRVGVLVAVMLMMGEAGAGTKTSVREQVFRKLGEEFVKAGGADGVSIAVVEKGKAWFYDFGVDSRESGKAPTRDSVYEIGSISKLMGSLILAHAVVEGKVGLQDDIRKYLPEGYANLVWEGVGVRVIDLVDTTSALPDNLPDFSGLVAKVGADAAVIQVSELLKRYGWGELLADLKTAKLVGRPGKEPRHSNVAATLVGIIAERVYGEKYEELVARLVERPFGMERGTGGKRAGLMVRGYGESKTAMPAFDARGMVAFGGLRYSAADMAKFIMGEIAGGAAVRLTQRPAWGDLDRDAVGFNWRITRAIDGQVRLSTSGGTWGGSSYIEIYPQLGYGVVLLANRSAPRTQGALQELAGKAMEGVHGRPAVEVALEAGLEKNGYRDVAAVVAEVRRGRPELHLTEDYVNAWGYRLLGAHRVAAAVGLFEYNVARWPQSWNVYDSLAEGYENAGDQARAVAHYRRSLELNPANRHAVDRLKALAAPAAGK